MHLLTGFLNTLILLGALQGFIVSGLLYFSGPPKKTGRLPKRLLAAFIFLLALACLNLYMYEQPWMQTSWITRLLTAIIPLIIVMPVGPLIYFHIRSTLEEDFRMDRKKRAHFYPVIIDFFQHFAAILYVIALLTHLVPANKVPFGTWMDIYDTYADIPRWLSLAIYLGLSMRHLQVASRRVNGSPDPLWTERLRWPRQLVRACTIFAVIWFIFLIPYEIPRYSDKLIDLLDWYPVYLPVVVLIYWLGIKGYFISYPGKAPVIVSKTAAAKSSIPSETASGLALVLKKCMEEERPWLQPDLNLNSLAAQTGLPPKTVSAVLNQYLNKSFNEFVNEYRIEAVKVKLLLPASRELTIAGVAYECGFNSLPTFQRSFKSIAGLTPKEFLAKEESEQTKKDQIRI